MLQQKNIILDPIKAAKEGLEINKSFTFSNLSKLHHCIVDASYSFDLFAKFDYQNRKPLLDAKLLGQIRLICQRTLEPFEYVFNHDIKLGFITDDRFFKNFPSDYEPYVYQDNQINLIHLIEEEILLLIPLIPKKPLNDCQVEKNASYYGVLKTGDEKKQDKPNPFDALKELKFTKKD